MEKDALYEEVRKPGNCRTRVSIIARVMDSEQLKQAREEVVLARAETAKLLVLAEESA